MKYLLIFAVLMLSSCEVLKKVGNYFMNVHPQEESVKRLTFNGSFEVSPSIPGPTFDGAYRLASFGKAEYDHWGENLVIVTPDGNFELIPSFPALMVDAANKRMLMAYYYKPAKKIIKFDPKVKTSEAVESEGWPTGWVRYPMLPPARWYLGVARWIDAWQVEGLGGYRDNQYKLTARYPSVFVDPEREMLYFAFGVEEVIVRTPPALMD